MPKIHNRGRKIGEKTVARKITFPKAWDDKGMPVREGEKLMTCTLEANAHMDVSKEQLKHLKENFGDEIINLDDMAEMQAQFQPGTPAKPREGYVSPDEVDALVEKRVQERMANMLPEPGKDDRKDLIEKLDKMDRSELVAFIEENGLNVEHKNLKAPGVLKAAVLSAIENQEASKSEE